MGKKYRQIVTLQIFYEDDDAPPFMPKPSEWDWHNAPLAVWEDETTLIKVLSFTDFVEIDDFEWNDNQLILKHKRNK